MDGSVSGVGVLDKAVEVLDALAAEPRSLADLVLATGLPRATAHRLAGALEVHGFVRRDGEGRYTLGPRLATLGRAAAASYPLADVARPVLEHLRDRTGESVQLFVRHGEAGRLCLVSLESTHGLRWIVPEGAVLPIDRGSAGRALLAGPAVRVVQSVEEREPGVASVSAPVRDGAGRVVAAVSVSGPVERLSRQPRRRFGAAVQAAAQALSSAVRS